jgi:hypothetical protein
MGESGAGRSARSSEGGVGVPAMCAWISSSPVISRRERSSEVCAFFQLARSRWRRKECPLAWLEKRNHVSAAAGPLACRTLRSSPLA